MKIEIKEKNNIYTYENVDIKDLEKILQEHKDYEEVKAVKE